MYILGINSAYHESSACLILDGHLIAAVEEERFTRKKHAKFALVDNPHELPWRAIDYCLRKRNICLGDIDHIGFSLNPWERRKRNQKHKHPYTITPGNFGTTAGEQLFFEKNLEVEEKMRKAGFRGFFHYLNHHDCHAASAFFISPFKSSAVLVIDGIGEFENTGLYRGVDNHLEKIWQIDYPNSLGFLWERTAKFLGFTEYDASKVMGLSSYGNPHRYRKEFSLIIRDSNNRYVVDDKITKFRIEDYASFEKLFGFSKRSEPIKEVGRETRKYADVAAALQEVTEKIVIKFSSEISKNGFDNLCLSGGLALNCVANGKLLQQRLFQDVFIQPASHDAGTAIGAAYYIWNQILERPRSYVFVSPFLGPRFSSAEIKEALDKKGLVYSRRKNIEQITAKLLSKGNIVAWFQGALEIGPRALGNRSILADPRKKSVIQELNEKVKHRESFRPFCPSILIEKVNQWFDLSGNRVWSPAYYMLGAFKVWSDKKAKVPAVVHVDGTSRIQVVCKELNEKYHTLIQEFEKLTGIPMVLNTSFNDHEPIVCSPEDAVKTFFRVKIDYLAIGDFLVSKKDNEIRGKIPDISLKEYFEELR